MSKINGVTEVNGVNEYRYFADGEWRATAGNKLFDVYNPYDRSLFARVAAGRKADAQLAVAAAAKAFPAWAATTPAERAKLFFKAAEIVKRRRVEIERLRVVHSRRTTVSASARLSTECGKS